MKRKKEKQKVKNNRHRKENKPRADAPFLPRNIKRVASNPVNPLKRKVF